MAKFYTYVVITSVLTALLFLFGIGGFSTLSWLSNPVLLIVIMTGFITILAGTGALSIIPGLTSFSKTDLATTALVGGTLAVFVYDFIMIITTTAGICPASSDCGWIYYLVWLIMAPLGVGFAISLYDWVRGAYN